MNTKRAEGQDDSEKDERDQASVIHTDLVAGLPSEATQLTNLAQQPERKAFYKRLSDAAAAGLRLFCERVETKARIRKAIIDEAEAKKPEYNRLIDETNGMSRGAETEYREMRTEANEEAEPLKSRLKIARRELVERKTAHDKANTALQTKEARLNRMNELKKQHGYVRGGGVSIVMTVLEWGYRLAIGMVLGVSIGLLIGTLSPYRLLTYWIGVFWVIGFFVFALNGEVAKQLAEMAAKADKFQSGKKGWHWWLISYLVVIWPLDALLAMFGVFRMVSASSFMNSHETHIPLPVIFAMCSIFILPYLYYESLAGYRKVEREWLDKELEEIKASMNEMDKSIDENVMIEEKAEVAELKVHYDEAAREVEELESQITEIYAKVEKERPTITLPLPNLAGKFPNGQIPHITSSIIGSLEILKNVDPPMEEAIMAANIDLANALRELEEAENDARRELLESEVPTPPERKGGPFRQ